MLVLTSKSKSSFVLCFPYHAPLPQFKQSKRHHQYDTSGFHGDEDVRCENTETV